MIWPNAAILLGASLIAVAACMPWSPRGLQSGARTVEAPSVEGIASPIYGIGRVPAAQEIAEWDIDVMPDGEGLPAGKGSVEKGRMLYVERCVRCHGKEGRGGPFDPLAGRVDGDGFPFALDPGVPRTIGNYWPWATTIFDYTRRAMPLDRPGSLEDDEVYSLTAYLLFLNGLLERDAELDRESLPMIVMPAKNRFVVDDRRGGPEIR